MHRTERDILVLFRDEPSLKLSTSKILQRVFSEPWKEAKELLNNNDSLREGKRLKARLHRRLLYHLTRLEEDKLLNVVEILPKGEKVFALASNTGTIVLGRRVSIELPPTQDYNIDFDDESIIPYSKSTLITRANAILIDASETSGINRCDLLVREGLTKVNDVLGLNHFESIIDSSKPIDLKNFLAQWDVDCRDYDKRVCLLVRLDLIKNTHKAREFITIFSERRTSHLKVIFEITPQTLKLSRSLLLHLIQKFSETRTKINIKNQSLQKPSYLIGAAGTYTFLPNGSKSVNASLIIDVKKALTKSKKPKDFRYTVRKAAHLLLEIARKQREHPTTTHQDGSYYIRFWNYDWEDEEHALTLIKSCKDAVIRFAKDAEIISLSSGLPLKFSIRFSSLIKNWYPELSTRSYNKKPVRSSEDLTKVDFNKYITQRERAFEFFHGGDRLRFFRVPFNNVEDVLHEFNTLLVHYSLPAFTYDFSEMANTTTLERFLQ